MKQPEHPGKQIRVYIEDEDWTVTQAAKELKIGRPALSNVLNGHASISPRLALSLEGKFAWPAEYWLSLQMHYDLALARKGRKK